MEATEKKSATPPYVAYRTLTNFLERFKQGLPGRIDRGLMGSMSGAAQSQVTTTLRYLGMISENNLPNPIMKRYVSGEEVDRKAALREMLEKSYPFIFDGDFDISTATAHMLRENFAANTSATGETISRCIAFLKDAAFDAGIVVSPYILQKGARNSGGSKRRIGAKKQKEVEPIAPVQTVYHAPKAPSFAAQSSLLLTGLFQRLPAPGTKWEKEDRERWVQTLQNVLVLEYPEN
ncbi:MAG TPA: DUF5343 domain-containing protein [Terracidiphilus sp.]|jgi:hypothetical protein|nr:DUF5343 domain-containing protein [Terracidiphilus sp.]